MMCTGQACPVLETEKALIRIRSPVEKHPKRDIACCECLERGFQSVRCNGQQSQAAGAARTPEERHKVCVVFPVPGQAQVVYGN